METKVSQNYHCYRRARILVLSPPCGMETKFSSIEKPPEKGKVSPVLSPPCGMETLVGFVGFAVFVPWLQGAGGSKPTVWDGDVRLSLYHCLSVSSSKF
jgi:hypothetical protein